MIAYHVHSCDEDSELAGYTDAPVIWHGCFPSRFDASFVAEQLRERGHRNVSIDGEDCSSYSMTDCATATGMYDR